MQGNRLWSFVAVAVLGVAAPALADEAKLLDEARSVASTVPPKLLQVLLDEIGKGGAQGAIAACRDQAPKMASAASQSTGWSIRRVSLNNRNPKAVPDAWERAALEEFDRRASAGANPASLEKGELVDEAGKRSYRYMKALPTQELCLRCHGPLEKLDAAVVARLRELYPADRATGYAVGQIRGAMTIRKEL
ncbi:MAG: DUF3365 domain-containing protein [Burkholderiaceae bacterium]|nr:DUF3365 domain-containing protein [Burkholderiaceae bacterium]